MNEIIIQLTPKEASDVRELLVSLTNAKYATNSQEKVLIKIVSQMSIQDIN